MGKKKQRPKVHWMDRTKTLHEPAWRNHRSYITKGDRVALVMRFWHHSAGNRVFRHIGTVTDVRYKRGGFRSRCHVRIKFDEPNPPRYCTGWIASENVRVLPKGIG